mmetsp:Transcript_104448/g.184182  ORF Transcript_104448/g.184182 Transcript_104448/m.184182 type:complete len:88 (+) Transcript_104448:1506-1769(+)
MAAADSAAFIPGDTFMSRRMLKCRKEVCRPRDRGKLCLSQGEDGHIPMLYPILRGFAAMLRRAIIGQWNTKAQPAAHQQLQKWRFHA